MRGKIWILDIIYDQTLSAIFKPGKQEAKIDSKI